MGKRLPRLLLLAACALCCPAGSELHAAPPRGKPVRPVATGNVTLDGIEYVDAADVAKRFGLKTAWSKPNDRLVLKNDRLRIELEAASREIAVDGMRVFLGDAVRLHKRSLRVSKVDVDTLLTPLIRPGQGQTAVPDLKIIAIDPGHGGIDFGMINPRLKLNEKTFALDTSVRLKQLLEAQGYRVVMTRTDDRKIELADRPAIAARNGADLFLSLHFNAVAEQVQRVAGLEVYRFTPRNQAPITRTQRRPDDGQPNPADANAHWNSLAAILMHRALLAELKATDRGFKHDKLAVLRLATCPAILIESGFLSNDAEGRKIATPAYRQQIAEAVAEGVRRYAAALAALRAK